METDRTTGGTETGQEEEKRGSELNVAVNFWYKAHSGALLNVYEALRWSLS